MIHEFKYPAHGAGYPYTRMAEEIRELGGDVYLGQACTGIAKTEDGVEVQTNDHRFEGSHVISTMPLSQSCDLLSPPEDVKQALSQLSYRNTVLVYLEVEGDNPFPDNWMYIHSNDLTTGRITNFSNWGMQGNGQSKHILCLEYWCNSEDAAWQNTDADWERLGKQDLMASNLLNHHTISRNKIIRIPQSYPVYRIGYDALMQVIRNYLDTISWFTPIGRSGAFKYNNQDHSILMGLLAADNVSGKPHSNLWAINADVEYQETK